MRYGREKDGKYVIGDGLKYAYDANGNISAVYENGELLALYAYDALNRLEREDNAALCKTYLYSYDNNGNILSKRETAFTRNPLDEITTFEREQVYEYDAAHGDRLAAFDGQEIQYSATMENPVLYRGQALVWEKGRQLKSYGSVAFSYDGYGRRIGKGNTRYLYDSADNLIMQTDGENTLEFYYNESGLAGLSHNGAQYIFRKNVQGDITNLFDLQGNVVVKYVYDAWGNQSEERFAYTVNGKQVGADDPAHVGNLNPFRYRSYYYDVETRLYYLKSRYYDPEVGRFINADNIENAVLQIDQLNGLNLYAYCLNNPVDHIDPTGGFVISLLVAVLLAGAAGGVISFGASVISQGIAKGWDNINWGQAGVAGLLGFVGGALAATGLGIGAMIGIGASLGFVGGVSDALFEGKSFKDWQTWLDIGISTAIGAIGGLLGGKGASNYKSLTKSYYTSELVKANKRHALNLLKAATGQFKSGAGAASALRASSRALNSAVAASKALVIRKFGINLLKSILKSGGTTFFGNGIYSILSNFW